MKNQVLIEMKKIKFLFLLISINAPQSHDKITYNQNNKKNKIENFNSAFFI